MDGAKRGIKEPHRRTFFTRNIPMVFDGGFVKNNAIRAKEVAQRTLERPQEEKAGPSVRQIWDEFEILQQRVQEKLKRLEGSCDGLLYGALLQKYQEFLRRPGQKAMDVPQVSSDKSQLPGE